MKAERVVVDTNVLISAVLLPQGPPRAVVDVIRSETGVLLFSNETFDELRSRLYGPRFDGYVSREDRAVYLAQLQAVSEWVWIARAKPGCRDPDDDKLLETALMGEADCLTTGDRGLLDLSPFQEGETLEEMIKEDLVAERVAMETYSEIIRWLSNDDPTTRRIIEDILKMEEEHADDLASLLVTLGKVE